MARIYISSTFQDLQEHRRAMADALRKLGHAVIAMEDYVARDERPLDRVLADVERSDVYVGIFAWRYGFCPDGEPPSITERELNHAAERGVPRLIFILHEDAPWPPDQMDAVTGKNEGGARIRALRDRLGDAYLASMFRGKEELAMLASVATTMVGSPGTELEFAL